MKVIKSVLAVVLSLVMATAFIGCQRPVADGVAGVVNGTNISEADVTALIEYYRLDSETGSAMDDATWATYVSSVGIPTTWSEFLKGKGYTSETFTPEILREYVVRNNYGVFILMIQKAAEKGIAADQANLDTQMESIRTSASSEGSSLEEYVRARGFANEATYRLMLEAYEIAQPLAETLIAEPTQDEIDTYIRTNIDMYTGKRLSLIALPVDEENTADAARTKLTEAKAKIDSGTSFEDVAKETLPEGSQFIETGGDLGWGYESSMPDEVGTALETLAQNQVSDVIEVRTDSAGTTDDPSDDEVTSLYLVKWTESFELPSAAEDEAAAEEDAAEDEAATEEEDVAEDEGTTEDEDTTEEDAATEDDATTEDEVPNADLDLNTVPTSLKEELAKEAKDEKITNEQETYWTALAQSDEITVNPMPQGLSYDVDLSLATPVDDTTDTEEPVAVDSEEDVAAAEAEGLVIEDTVEGTGVEVKDGDSIEVYYTGMLTDGTEFDSNEGTGTPFSLIAGEGGSVIQGWKDGLIGMKVGGTRHLIIPPSLGYADSANGDIPANSILLFDVTLVSVNGDSTGYTDITEGIDDAETVIE